ncbi:MAG: hypothetical protein ACRDCD_02605 [Mycoplasmoidaceae bacterium]
MIEDVKVEKLDAKIISDKKFRKETRENNPNESKEELNNFQNLPFINLFLIITILFLSYLTISIMLIAFGVIAIHQSLWEGDLLNGFSSLPWGIVLTIIGALMALPIIKYIKILIKVLIQSHNFHKELRKLEELKGKHGI